HVMEPDLKQSAAWGCSVIADVLPDEILVPTIGRGWMWVCEITGFGQIAMEWVLLTGIDGSLGLLHRSSAHVDLPWIVDWGGGLGRTSDAWRCRSEGTAGRCLPICWPWAMLAELDGCSCPDGFQIFAKGADDRSDLVMSRTISWPWLPHLAAFCFLLPDGFGCRCDWVSNPLQI
ncbi:hypothetical protein ACLOJK_004787, partial [Asimina triloba]